MATNIHSIAPSRSQQEATYKSLLKNHQKGLGSDKGVISSALLSAIRVFANDMLEADNGAFWPGCTFKYSIGLISNRLVIGRKLGL